MTYTGRHRRLDPPDPPQATGVPETCCGCCDPNTPWERAVRAARTLLQGMVGAAVTSALVVAWDVLREHPTDVRSAMVAGSTAATAAVAAYLHKR